MRWGEIKWCSRWDYLKQSEINKTVSTKTKLKKKKKQEQNKKHIIQKARKMKKGGRKERYLRNKNLKTIY